MVWKRDPDNVGHELTRKSGECLKQVVVIFPPLSRVIMHLHTYLFVIHLTDHITRVWGNMWRAIKSLLQVH